MSHHSHSFLPVVSSQLVCTYMYPPLIINYRADLDTFCSCEANDRLPFCLINTGGGELSTCLWMYACMCVCTHPTVFFVGNPVTAHAAGSMHIYTFIEYILTLQIHIHTCICGQERKLNIGGPSVCQILCWSVHNPNPEGFFSVVSVSQYT